MIPKLAELAKRQKAKETGNILPLVEGHLASQWGRGTRDPYHLHPSEMARKDWCERSNYYRLKTGTWPKSEKFSFTMQSIFDEGHQIHDKWQTWLKGTGELWGDWRCSMCHEPRTGKYADLESDPPMWCPVGYGEPLSHDWVYQEVTLEHGIVRGHEDGAVGNRLVEVKSLGLGTLRHEMPELLSKYYIEVGPDSSCKRKKVYDVDGVWQALTRPMATHVRQATIYLWLAKMMGYDYPKCSIIYEYKPNQQAREFVIGLSQDVIGPLLERVSAVEEGLKHDRAPACPRGGCTQCRAYEQADIQHSH